MRWFCTPFLLLSLLLLTSTATAYIQDDVDGDGRIGLAEAIHALKAASELTDGSIFLVQAINALQVVSGLEPSCTLSFSPQDAEFGVDGGSGIINVTTPSTCSWSAEDYDDWINITSGSSGKGNGTVTYSVSVNDYGITVSEF